MLSYRHGFHAGNFADVFKHFILVYLLNHLKTKKPLTFIDPFAGAGTYPFEDKFMQKNKEYLTGISKVLNNKIIDPYIKDYLNLIHLANNNKKISLYPGAAQFALLTLDKKDTVYLNELHSNEYLNLKKNFEGNSNVKIDNTDAYSNLTKMIANSKGNKLVLIDPSYELKNEYDKVLKLIKHTYSQFKDVCYMIWYPDLKQDKTQKFVDDFLNLKIENTNHIHIELKNTNLRMQGTGFFIINLLKNDKESIDNALNELVQLFK